MSNALPRRDTKMPLSHAIRYAISTVVSARASFMARVAQLYFYLNSLFSSTTLDKQVYLQKTYRLRGC